MASQTCDTSRMFAFRQLQTVCTLLTSSHLFCAWSRGLARYAVLYLSLTSRESTRSTRSHLHSSAGEVRLHRVSSPAGQSWPSANNVSKPLCTHLADLSYFEVEFRLNPRGALPLVQSLYRLIGRPRRRVCSAVVSIRPPQGLDGGVPKVQGAVYYISGCDRLARRRSKRGRTVLCVLFAKARLVRIGPYPSTIRQASASCLRQLLTNEEISSLCVMACAPPALSMLSLQALVVPRAAAKMATPLLI